MKESSKQVLLHIFTTHSFDPCSQVTRRPQVGSQRCTAQTMQQGTITPGIDSSPEMAA